MRSRGGRYWIVFNGEIYNHVELRTELDADGVKLCSQCDTEVLLELFARYGSAVVHRLRGMYAFAVWDARQQELFAARDGFGIKPLFYCHEEGVLRFSSEKKVLIDPEHHPISSHALREYLALQYVPGPQTLSPSVRALPPGHVLKARPGQPLQVARYWKPVLRPAPRSKPETPRVVLAALRDSVEVHLRADVPIGAFLSGGIDSALICALAAERRPGLQTFTVGFDFPGYNEIAHAEATASALGLESNSYVVSMEEFVEHLPRIVWHLDDPVGNAAAVPLWFLAREAGHKVTCVMSGEGADELFGGYHAYRQHALVRPFDFLPDVSRPAFRVAARLLPRGSRARQLMNLAKKPPLKRYIGPNEVYVSDDVEVLRSFATMQDLAERFYRAAKVSNLDDVATMQLIDLEHWLPGDILAKGDRMTMAHGVELRVPFLDRDVMLVASGLARRDKVGGGTTKHALRQAAASLLPPSVVRRPKARLPGTRPTLAPR